MIASISGFLLPASDGIEGGFANGYMGTKGLLTAFLAAFITVNIYQVCVKNNVTIRMPDVAPPNVSQAVKDVIPYAL
ncbi:PTS transporter subunit EIIC, partial [Streptococcus suis]